VRSPIVSLLLLTLCLTLAAVPAMAGELYNNGTSTLETDAYTINFSFAVSDSFPLATSATVNSAQFIFWMEPGDILASVDLSIGTAAFGNNVANFTGLTPSGDTDLGSNAYGFDVREDAFTFPGINLNAGTYWITLQNAMVPSGDPVYWDESSGPSMAMDSGLGSIPSESFTIFGTATTGSTPEPGSFLLLASGILGVTSLIRRYR
jgi:hypothetical protein